MSELSLKSKESIFCFFGFFFSDLALLPTSLVLREEPTATSAENLKADYCSHSTYVIKYLTLRFTYSTMHFEF